MYKSLFEISIVPIHIWHFVFATLPTSCMTLLAFELSLHASNFAHTNAIFYDYVYSRKRAVGELWLHFVQGLTEDHIGRWSAVVTPPRVLLSRRSRETRIYITFGEAVYAVIHHLRNRVTNVGDEFMVTGANRERDKLEDWDLYWWL